MYKIDECSICVSFQLRTWIFVGINGERKYFRGSSSILLNKLRRNEIDSLFKYIVNEITNQLLSSKIKMVKL